MTTYSVWPSHPGKPLGYIACDTAAAAVQLGEKAKAEGATLVKYHRDGRPIESWEEMEGYLTEEDASGS